MVCHLFEGVPTDLPRADELLLPMYNFFLRSIVPRTLNELTITKLLMFSFSNVCSPDLASLVVGAPNLATDPRTRRHWLLSWLEKGGETQILFVITNIIIMSIVIGIIIFIITIITFMTQ